MPSPLKRTRSQRARPQGAGSLALLLVLLLAAALTLLYANRALIFEQRASANQVRAARALEAAEAGLAWTLSRLNHPGSVDDACQASSAADDRRFATRYLSAHPDTGLLTPAVNARVACVAVDANGWSCHCPSAGEASLTTPGGDGDLPAFTLQFTAGPRPGMARVRIDACSSWASPCSSSLLRADATARIDTLLATLGAVARTPYAALTARGAVSLQGDAVIAHTEAPGLTVASAGALAVEPSVNLHTVPGQEPSQSLLGADPTWLDSTQAVFSTARFFAAHFALERGVYKALPSVHVLPCASACGGSDLDSAYAGGARILWVAGGLTLSSTLSLGNTSDPMTLVVEGPLTVSAPVTLSGLVYAGSVQWAGGAGALGRLDGALVSEGPVQLSGRVQVRHDAAVLTRLRHAQGLFVPVPGTWRDFE